MKIKKKVLLKKKTFCGDANSHVRKTYEPYVSCVGALTNCASEAGLICD